MKGSARLFPLPFTAFGTASRLGTGVPEAFAVGEPGSGVRTGGPFLHGTGPTIRFFSVSSGMMMGLGDRFPFAPAVTIAGFTGTLTRPTPPGNGVVTRGFPITALTDPGCAATWRSTMTGSAGKGELDTGRNETISHTAAPIVKDKQGKRIVNRTPSRPLPGLICITITSWFRSARRRNG